MVLDSVVIVRQVSQGDNGCSCWIKGYLNDLWMWNGTIWTWMGGSSSINDRGVFNKAIHSLSIPSARTSVATRSINNNAYLFGGNGYDSLGEYGKRKILE